MQRVSRSFKGSKLQVDYVGQNLANKLAHSVFVVGFPISLIVGMYKSNFMYLCYMLLATLGVCFVVVVPPWPIYRRNPVVFGDKKKK